MAVAQLRQPQYVAVGQRIVGAQDHADRIGPQCTYRQGGLVERCPGQRDVDESGAQPAGGVGQVGVADADVDAGAAPAIGGGQPGHSRVVAVAQDADGEGRGAGRGTHPYPDAVGMVEKGPRLAEQHLAHRSERDPRGQPGEQQRSDLGLQLLDRPAQRRLAHVQSGRGPAEMELLGDRHEVAQGS